MRLVLDTNTVVSGLIWGGSPGHIIDAAAAGRAELFSSLPLLTELIDVLGRPKFEARLSAQAVAARDLFEGYVSMVRIVEPAIIGPVINADPDDDSVLATAVAAGADTIVSGDRHLLSLGSFRGIPIRPPQEICSTLGL